MFVSALALFVERRLTWHGRPFGPTQTGYVWAYAGFLGSPACKGLDSGDWSSASGNGRSIAPASRLMLWGIPMLAFAHSIGVAAGEYHCAGDRRSWCGLR